MSSIKTYIKKHAVLTYFVLAIAISWGSILIAVGGIPANSEQPDEALALMYVAMLLGPSVAGVLLTALVSGKAGFRALLSRLFRWRVDVRWYAAALLTAPLVATTVLLVLSLLSPEFLPGIFTADDKPALLMSGIMVGLMVGFFEELGWTGFAVPRLKSRYGVLSNGLILGVVWGAWHFLPFWESNSFSDALPFAILLAQLFSWLPPYRIFMVWVYERTESLLLIIFMHASLLASLQILVPAALAGATLLTWLLAWAAALWVTAAVILVTQRRSSHSMTIKKTPDSKTGSPAPITSGR